MDNERVLAGLNTPAVPVASPRYHPRRRDARECTGARGRLRLTDEEGMDPVVPGSSSRRSPPASWRVMATGLAWAGDNCPRHRQSDAAGAPARGPAVASSQCRPTSSSSSAAATRCGRCPRVAGPPDHRASRPARALRRHAPRWPGVVERAGGAGHPRLVVGAFALAVLYDVFAIDGPRCRPRLGVAFTTTTCSARCWGASRIVDPVLQA